MYRFLKQWLRSPARRRRERRPGSFRPALEAFEDRQLLSAAPVVNAMVNEDFFVDRNSRLWKIDHTQTRPFSNSFLETSCDNPVRASSLSVGTDENSRGMAAYINNADGQAYEWSDTRQTPLSLFNSSLGVTNNIAAVAAGQGGFVFVLTTDHHLTRFDAAHQQWTDVAVGVASVSASASHLEAFDANFGLITVYTVKPVMADVVMTDGTAWEWSPVGFPWCRNLTPLANSGLGISNNVKSVSRAATGVSFVLLTSGVLFEYDPASQAWNNLGGNIASVSAGTDGTGNAMASVITLNGALWNWSTSHPWDATNGYFQPVYDPIILTPYNPRPNPFHLPLVPTPPVPTVVSFTAGANGISDYVLSDGSLYQYSDATHQWMLLDSGAA